MTKFVCVPQVFENVNTWGEHRKKKDSLKLFLFLAKFFKFKLYNRPNLSGFTVVIF